MFTRVKKMFFLLMATCLIAVGATVIGASAALATSGYGYDGQDPVATGCANSAYTVGSANITRSGEGVVGLFELRYSPVCGTNWGRVTSYQGVQSMGIRVSRQTPSAYYDEAGYYSSAWTNMVYAPTTTACAQGWMGETNTPEACA